MDLKLTIDKYYKKLNVSYARYLKFKRADRYSTPDGVTFAERHTARVNYLKKFIFRMVILLTLMIIVWPFVNKDWGGSKIEFQNEDAAKSAKANDNASNLPVMMRPNFYGNDNNNQPYNISADSGVSVSENKTVLSHIKADMALKDSSRINIESSRGDYANKDKQLILNDGVIINTESGYELKTNSAYIKLNENMATGSEKVYITGRLGDVEANGFTIRDSGDEILLFGGVHLITQPENNELKPN